jgi:uncharacterized protein YfiM (DUF2279 family)
MARKLHAAEVIKASIIKGAGSKLQQCLNLSCDKKKVARLVSCKFKNDSKHALVSQQAIAMLLQKAWGIRNAYKHAWYSCC